MLVTNQLQYARPADKILYMADGRVVESGTYDELMERGGGFAQLMQQTEVCALAVCHHSQLITYGGASGIVGELHGSRMTAHRLM